MAIPPWKEFLVQWSKDVLELDEYRTHMPPDVLSSGWLGYPGAIEEQITTVENRLGARLPDSYRQFLKVTNGWRLISSFSFMHNLWPVEQIDWLFVRNQSLIDGWLSRESNDNDISPVSDEEYFIYGDGQDSTAIRSIYLHNALQLSDWENSGIYLLNPQVTFDDEWETWFYANWLPGANRYRSFWEMMQMEYELFLEARNTQ